MNNNNNNNNNNIIDNNNNNNDNDDNKQTIINNANINLETSTNLVDVSGSTKNNNNDDNDNDNNNNGIIENNNNNNNNNSNSNNNMMISLPQNFLESLIPSIGGTVIKRDSESYIFNNCNFIINQNTEITKTNNEVNITENNQIDNSKTTSTSNVNIKETINNNTTIYNYNTNYNVFNNSFFDFIQRFLDKGCTHENQKVRTFYKISKHSYKAFCKSVNFSVNALIKTFNISKWIFAQFKDFEKNFKGMIWFIGVVLVIVHVYRNDYLRGIIVKYIKSLFYKGSSQTIASATATATATATTAITATTTNPSLPTSEIPFLNNNKDGINFDKINKTYNLFVNKNPLDLIKYIIELSGQKINSALNQTEHFVINNSKSAFNYTNKIINTTTPAIKDVAYQFYSAVNTTLTSSIPVLEDKINSTLSFIFQKNRKDDSDIFKSMSNLLSQSELVKLGNSTYSSLKKSLNNTYVNDTFSKLKNIFSNTTSENIKEMNNKIADNAEKVIKNNETLKKFFNNVRNILKQERN
ncbi:hypothetical protein BCR32DRAFT_289962 [Anaeromyces robustus]|uniref:Uncharacterized protein n=1 Tax=Anaeromyces robustus TaxID=1754192 RepID=A0A1Y1XL99_9FUNG|nr:hypothetical protein BCR32DRAFT_289962 [Anaeromyces robustus]|eukprot:ORX86537.1 hypothetical protein BCR32DRAFT_289962 [Anaeromyces robustus]